MVTSVSGLAVLFPAPSAYASGTSFTSTGSEQTYSVPPGVTSVTVTAVGAPGGTGVAPVEPPGGDGASVTATVAVTPGETLYVEVGGDGATGPCSVGGTTGTAFNGGGSSVCGGGGGGASDVRTCSMTACPNLTPDTRLVVAGGGGGRGASNSNTAAAGGQGGDNAALGAGTGGNGCDHCAGGAGGNGGFGSPLGTGGNGTSDGDCTGGPGTLGQGGRASASCDPTNYGGGGGGGYDGGGAGGDGFSDGGGGGAGSSYWVPSASNTTMTEDTTGVPEVTITPHTATFTPNGSEVRAVVQVETSPAYAGDTVQISSSQLEASCGGTIFFETLQGGSTIAPTISVNSITVVLDDDGNVTVVVEGAPCAPGPDLIEADLTVAPYLTATTVLDVEPPQMTPSGVSANPSTEVETGNSATSGNSDVYTVFYVETDPVYAEQPVTITSPQLDARCGQGWRWEPGTGPAVDQTSGTNVATATLDDDGNATFVFKGASCAAGDSTVIADVDAGTHPTYTTTFTIAAPIETLASIKMRAKVAAKARHHRRHKGSGGAGSGTGSGSGSNPAMTVTASPNALIETGEGSPTPSATLNVVKSDSYGGTSNPPTPGNIGDYNGNLTYTIMVSNTGTTALDGVVVSDPVTSDPDYTSDTYTATATGAASGFTPSGGSGDIDDTVDLPPDSTITYMVMFNFDTCGNSDSLSNTVTLSPPPGVTLSPGSNTTATDNDDLPGC